MFICQAQLAFKTWHNILPKIDKETIKLLEGQTTSLISIGSKFWSVCMIRIAVLGDIGSGKSYAAKQFGYPVFNADTEVTKLYWKNKKCYNKLKKIGIKNCRLEGRSSSEWKLIDAVDIIIHIFHPEKRKFYGLEKMWSELIPKQRLTKWIEKTPILLFL